jgi:diguanylate cyclase (GGDEF)-like protein
MAAGTSATVLVILTDVLSVLGSLVLIGALVPVQKLIAELPPGSARRHWHFLRALIAFVVLGYIAYAVGQWNDPRQWGDLLVPSVFLLGACTVLIITIMSRQTALDIRHMAVLEQQSITDPLMAIYNRRYLDGRLRQELLRARRHGLPLSVLLIDIDHFKAVNDTWGHPVGDQALIALGKLIVSHVRVPDTVVRYGGEEVLVLAPDTPLTSAHKLGERLRQSVDESVLVWACPETRGQNIHVTVSIGVTELGPEPDDARGLLDRADKALYRAKSAGRNCVVASTGEVPAA